MSLAAMAAISAIPSVVQGVSGIIQARQGRKMADQVVIPEYQTPEAVKKATALSARGVGTFEMPGQDQILQSISAQEAALLNQAEMAATGSPNLLSAMVGAASSGMASRLNVGAQAAQSYMDRVRGYESSLQTLGSYQEKEMMDKIARGERAAAAAAGLMQAGRQNMFAGLSNLAGIGANAAMLKSGTDVQEDPGGAPMMADAQATSYSSSGLDTLMKRKISMDAIKNILGIND